MGVPEFDDDLIDGNIKMMEIMSFILEEIRLLKLDKEV